MANTPEEYVASLRQQQVDMRRLSELYAESEQARIAANQQILALEEEALEIESNRARSVEEMQEIERKLGENKHQQALAAKRLSDLEKKRAADAADAAEAYRQQNTETAKAQRLVQAISDHWQVVAVTVASAVAAINAANDAMEKNFSNRNIFSNLPYQIDGARAATLGFVEDTELARLAIEAQRLGVTKSEKDFDKLTWAATRLGLSVGKSAVESVENLNGALGRNETELLDNLGISLRVSEAQRLYALQLGVATNALTEQQKAEAFKVIGMQKAIEAAEKVTISVTDSEQAWLDARQTYQQLGRETLPQVSEALMPLWQGLAELGEIAKIVAPVVAKYLQGIGKMIEWTGKLAGPFIEAGKAVWRVLGSIAEIARSVVDGIGSIADTLSDTWVGDAARGFMDLAGSVLDFADNALERLRAAAEENIPYAKELFSEWDRLKNTLIGPDDVGTLGLANPAEALNDLFAKGRDIAATTAAHEKERQNTIQSEIDSLDHQVKLGEAQGKSAKSLEDLLLRQYDLRIQLLTAQGDEKKLQEAVYAEEIRREKAKRKGAGKGPTEADRIKAEGMATVQWMQAEVEYAEVLATLRGTEKQDAGEIARLRLEAADAALELEAEALSVTRAKNSVERQNIQNRLDAIERERELLGLKYQAEEQAAAKDLAGKAADDIRKRMELEREGYETQREQVDNVISLEAYRYQRNEQAIRHQAELATMSAQTELQRLGIAEQMEAGLHANRIAQLNSEHDAMLRVFELREQEVALMEAHDPASAAKRDDAARQLAHDREMERLQYELATKQAIDSEEQRIAEAQRARRDATFAQIEEYVTGLQQLYGQISDFAGTFMQMTAERDQAELDRQVASMEARGRAQQEALDREIEAAEGNVALQNQLRRKGAKQQAALDRQIEKAKEQHAEKQRKIESRMAGFKLLIDAVVYGVQAAGAYASYNYVQGALFTAAAVLAGAQGAMLIAGNIPGAGGGSMGGAGAGVGSGAGGFGDTQTVDPNKIPGSDPGQAAGSAVNRQPKGAQQGATIINIQNINATGAIDDETAEKFVRAAKRVANSRET